MSKPSVISAELEPAVSPERTFAEEFGVVGELIGMPRMTARLLG
jgi:hypothetical protein